MKQSRRGLMVVVAAWCFGACTQTRERAPVLGHAFVGPATLQIRKELVARSPLAATVHHGDRLDLIGRRRRFYEVRTASGAEGWVDGRQLLSPESMEQLAGLAKQVAGAPGQGQATVFDALNVHTEPNRQAPSSFQIEQGRFVDVVAYLRAPRVPFDTPDLIESDPPAAKRVARPPKEPPVPPPPPGKAPPVPGNWLSLSGNPEGKIQKKVAPAGAPGVALEDWALVRDKEGRAGWALVRSLFMAAPDEVAQYAERARISAFFAIGTVEAKPERKKVWLWAALSPGVHDRDFDSLRIFTYSTRRQRYETAFIERGLRGWLPILVTGGEQGARSFRVVVEEKNGTITEREYSLTGYRARITARRAAKQPEPYWQLDQEGHGKRNPLAGSRRDEGWTGKAQDLIEGLKGRLKR